MFTAEGIRILRSPPQAPRANAICEQMIGTLRRELLARIGAELAEHRVRRKRVLGGLTNEYQIAA